MPGKGQNLCSLATNTPISPYDVPIGQNATYGPSVAQSFMVNQQPLPAPTPTSSVLKNVTVALSREGSFPFKTQTLQATIQLDASGASATSPSAPSGTALLTSVTLDPGALSTRQTPVTFTFQSGTGLRTNQIYWLVLTGSWPASDTGNYVNWWGINNASQPYQFGSLSLPAKYMDTHSASYQNADIGSNVFMFFNLGC
jgi:hypothetical protein